MIGMMARKENSRAGDQFDWKTIIVMSLTDGSGTICIPDALWPIIYQYDEPQNLVVRATSTDKIDSGGRRGGRYP